LDCWATPEENKRAARRFEKHATRNEREAMRRNEIMPWVAEVIEKHERMEYERGEEEEVP